MVYIDQVLEYGSEEEVKSLKEGFGLGDIKEKGDFVLYVLVYGEIRRFCGV